MEGALRRTLNLAKPDDVYNALVDAHKGLSDEECANRGAASDHLTKTSSSWNHLEMVYETGLGAPSPP